MTEEPATTKKPHSFVVLMLMFIAVMLATMVAFDAVWAYFAGDPLDLKASVKHNIATSVAVGVVFGWWTRRNLRAKP